MSDEGERTCPLCAEEMDLTDQQLKPCKCGYEICVWCWHHIMDMAEKDNTEGRCPACRTPYNKEKIVGTASKCERLVTGMSVDKKLKSQKGKTKTPEGRKQLGSVRVIQRNLVYVVGLPLNLADEDLLQQKEYFGQYGKVLKVSISRTAAGAIQQFANNTCSVYVTYSKEEEAVRSIQSAHGFVLEGRPLRACFGTTKYCHAWLRNAPCTNADCLYLHEFGLQEDSFTKDEIISAYTRNRVQQITGATNDMQRRSGNLLPPPADDYSNNSTSWGKTISKSTTNNPANSIKVSPPNSSSGRSVALPAAALWGTCSSNSQPLAAIVTNSNGPFKQEVDACNTTLSFSTAVVSPLIHGNEIKKKHGEESHSSKEKGNLEHPAFMKEATGTDHRRTLSEMPVTTGLPSSSTSSSQLCTTSPKAKNISGNVVPDFSGSSQIYRHHSNPVLGKDLNVADSLSIDKNRRSQPCAAQKITEPSASHKAEDTAKLTISVTREQSDLVSDLQKKVAEISISEAKEDLLAFNDQRLRDSEVVTHTHIQNVPHFCHPKDSMGYSLPQVYASVNGSLDPPSVDQNLEKASQHAFNIPVVNGYSSILGGNSSLDSSNGQSYLCGIEGGRRQMGIFEEAAAAPAKGEHNTALDLGESSIISNILSMDFDPWDESSTSPQNLAKLLGEGDKPLDSHRVSSSRKAQNSTQSRFSFARQDEGIDQGSNYAPSLSDFGQGLEYKNFSPDFVSNSNIYLDNKLSDASFSFEESENFANDYSAMPENKISVSRARVSAPPGFSGTSRAPPPGFPSHERMELPFDNLSGNYMFDTPPLLRKTHQSPTPVNIASVGDVEFMDPAILAVGGRVSSGLNSPGLDMRSSFPARLNSFKNDARLQLLMQGSFSQQNPRFTELEESFPQQTDCYGIPSSILEQALPNNLPHYQQTSFQQPRSSLMSNGHWDGWNEHQSGNDTAMAELLNNERLGFNRYYSGHEDTKFRLRTSGDLYNRSFGI